MYIILRIRGSKKCKSVVIDHRQFRQSSKGWVQNCAAQHGQFQGMESSWRSFGWDSLAMLPLSLGSHDVTPGDCTPIASDLPSVWAQSTTATVAGFILPKCHMTWEFRTFATSVCFRPCRHTVPCHAMPSFHCFNMFSYVPIWSGSFDSDTFQWILGCFCVPTPAEGHELWTCAGSSTSKGLIYKCKAWRGRQPDGPTWTYHIDIRILERLRRHVAGPCCVTWVGSYSIRHKCAIDGQGTIRLWFSMFSPEVRTKSEHSEALYQKISKVFGCIWFVRGLGRCYWNRFSGPARAPAARDSPWAPAFRS